MQMTKTRRARLNRLTSGHGLDAIFITNPVNIFYLTSLDVHDASLLLGPGCRVLLTDFRYAEAARKALPGFTILAQPGALNKRVVSIIRSRRIRRIGFESEFLTHSQYGKAGRFFHPAKLIPTMGLVEALREIKDPSEVRCIRKAIDIAGKGLRAGLKGVRASAIEKDVADLFEATIKKAGADGLAFESIIAASPRSSMPHYTTGRRTIGRGKQVVLDVGVRYMKYNCDLTRVAFLDKIKPKFSAIYSIIIEAQNKAIGKIRPGELLSDIDRAARDYIEKKGYGKFFGHALGHGIGLEVHERPYVSSSARGVLKPGMVFTVEPGIYIPGFGGVRVEDMVLVTEKGCEVLTDDLDK